MNNLEKCEIFNCSFIRVPLKMWRMATFVAKNIVVHRCDKVIKSKNEQIEKQLLQRKKLHRKKKLWPFMELSINDDKHLVGYVVGHMPIG